MTSFDFSLTRRVTLLGVAAASVSAFVPSRAAGEPLITVHKDPNCGCCSGWVEHLKTAGFVVDAIDTPQINRLKAKLGVPNDLAACHTAEVAGYVIEGHVPAVAIRRLLAEKPEARGLAVPGMPVGSPGMEGGTLETYEAILFGPSGRRTYMRLIEDRAI